MPPKQEGTINSIIGEGSVFQGKFYVNGSIQIDGKFEGEISTNEQIIIGETGKVKTDVLRAKSVTVSGVVIGGIEAHETVKLNETGRVLGNITTPQLEVKPGVILKGEVTITAGQKKDVDKIIEDSYNSGPSIPASKEPIDKKFEI
ncbi:MAG: polymer-forming cytoskeletal protein [Brevinematia bacterium]